MSVIQRQNQSFGEYLDELQATLGFKQRDLAEKLGVCRSYIAQMQLGYRAPSLRVLHTLRVLYGFSVDQFLDNVPPSTIPS